MDFQPADPLPATDTARDVLDVVGKITLPDGIAGLRVYTSTEVWTFYVHPTYGMIPRLVYDAGDIKEVWPANKELGGVWVTYHVLPDQNLLPVCYVEPNPSFVTGDATSQNRQKVSVPGGFMALTPTTVRQWNWFADAKGKSRKPTVATSNSRGTVDINDHPVVEVSYWDACAFAEWAGVSIPSSAEWEHAARGNDSRKYPWGNESPTDDKCWSSILTVKDMTDNVHNRPAGMSPYGCLDMCGNVWEWTSTVHK